MTETARRAELGRAAGMGLVAGLVGVAVMTTVEKVEQTWPAGERLVDVTHKAVYSVVTGLVADRTVSPVLQSQRGLSSH